METRLIKDDSLSTATKCVLVKMECVKAEVEFWLFFTSHFTSRTPEEIMLHF